MNRNPEVETQNEGRQDGEYVVRRSRLSDIIAILVCAVLPGGHLRASRI